MLLQPGDQFDADRLDRSLKYAVRHRPVPRRAGRAARATASSCSVVENPIVNRVAFEGNRKISTTCCASEVQLRPRAVFTAAGGAGRPRSGSSNSTPAAAASPRRSSRRSSSSTRTASTSSSRSTRARPRWSRRINFVGNTAYLRQPAARGGRDREQAWYRILSTSDIYDPERLTFDRELLRRFYLRNGYADVQITSATAELAPDRSGFFVTYTIDEGAALPRRQGRRRLRRCATSTPAALRRCVELDAGDWYDGDAVERAVAGADRTPPALRG